MPIEPPSSWSRLSGLISIRNIGSVECGFTISPQSLAFDFFFCFVVVTCAAVFVAPSALAFSVDVRGIETQPLGEHTAYGCAAHVLFWLEVNSHVIFKLAETALLGDFSTYTTHRNLNVPAAVKWCDTNWRTIVRLFNFVVCVCVYFLLYSFIRRQNHCNKKIWDNLLRFNSTTG